MDLLHDEPPFALDGNWRIYSSNPSLPPHYIGREAHVSRSMVSEGSMVFGEVHNSVIFQGVRIGKGARVTNSVIMPFAKIEEGAVVDHAILAQGATIAAGAKVEGEEGAIAVIPENEVITAEAGSKQVG